ncbi:MAG: ABC transporter permease subunit [Desulfovibrio sp.]|nr:ABC transporter permease subunit [Desulfovibrio sp.]
MNIRSYILRRLLGLAPLLLAISFFSFVIIQLSPSDPAEVAIRVNAMTPTPELIAEVREEMGLDKPFLERYLTWLNNAVHGDLGKRYVDGKPVAGEMLRALPPTLMLAATSAVLMLTCSIAAAFVGVLFEGRWPDLLLRGLVFLGTSVPAFWAGLLLIWLFAVHLDLLPTSGLSGPTSLILPAVTLALPYISAYARLLRNSMVQTKQQNFVLYAKACGRRRGAVLRHIFRNSLQSSLTGLGMSLPKLVAGTFVVECIFAWPGLGRLCVTAIFNRDFPVIQAYVLLMAVLFVLCNLCMDICSALVDPRLRERGLQ